VTGFFTKLKGKGKNAIKTGVYRGIDIALSMIFPEELGT
jgi:hypothetical protein